jgi:hypothetical protein
MNHYDRKFAVACLRHHVPHIHLVNSNVSAWTEVAKLALRLFNFLATDKEAALCLKYQR